MIGIMKCQFTSFASLRHRLTTMRDDFLFFFQKTMWKDFIRLQMDGDEHRRPGRRKTMLAGRSGQRWEAG